MDFARLFWIVTMVLVPHGTNAAELGVVLSQQGADQLSNYTVQQAMTAIQNNPVSFQVENKDKPSLRPLGRVLLANFLQLKNIKLLLLDNHLGVILNDFVFNSTMNLTADLWPLPVGDESVAVNFTLSEAYLGIATNAPNSSDAKRQKFWLETCTASQPGISTKVKNYWLLSTGVKMGASYMKKNFKSVFCPQMSSMINRIRSMTNSKLPITNYLDKRLLIEGVESLYVRYELVEFTVEEGFLKAGVGINWFDGDNDSKSTKNEVPSLSLESNGITDGTDPHVTLWMQENVINDLLQFFKWDFEWMKDKVPVGDDKIPPDTRHFLSTLCSDCYFNLTVRNFGPPKIIAQNGSLSIHRYDKVRLSVVNPRVNKTSIFVSFLLFFDGKVVPYIEEGKIKAVIELLGVKVNMTKSAFPAAWGHFIKDLVQSMITGMVWPGIEGMIKKYSQDHGLKLPDSCGIDPKSAEILLEDGRFGISTNLKLFQMSLSQCGTDITASLPVKKQ